MNSRDLLGTLLQAGLGSAGPRRIEHAIGRDGTGGSFGRILQDLSATGGGLGGGGGMGRGGMASAGGLGSGGLGGMLGGGGAGGGGLGGMLGGAGGGGGGLGDLLGGVLGGGARGGGGGLGGGGLGDLLGGGGGRMNPAAMGGIGALAGALLGGRRAGGGGMMRGAVGAGAITVLAGIAMDALARRNAAAAAGGTAGRAAPTPAPAPDPAVALPQDEAGQERLAALLMRAMLSAAKADGQIDGNEMQRIMGRLDEDGADPAAKDALLDEMRRPPDIAGLAREARSPEIAAQVYAASLLAIEVDTQAERDYLLRLADALGLDAATTARLHESLGAPAVAASASGTPRL